VKNLFQSLIILFISTSSLAQLEWESKASLPDYGLSQGVGFGVRGKAIFGLGRQPDNNYTNRMWQYDPNTELVSQITSYPGSGSVGCIFFVIGDKAYAGMGQSKTNRYTDFYEYNSVTDVWTSKASFPGGVLVSASSFTIGDTAYIVGGSCGGTTCYNNDLWMYVPSTNSWTQRADFPGGNRAGLSTFSIGQFGYAGNGISSSKTLSNNFWRYNPSNNSWTSITSMPGTNRRSTVSYVIDGKAYVGTGTFNWTPIVNQNDFYRYNPIVNSWTQFTSNSNFVPRHVSTLAQVNDSTIIVATGYSQSGSQNLSMADIWQLKVNSDTCDYYDTTFVQDTTFVTDTTFINDTTFTTIYDTSYVIVKDTQTVYKLDTIEVYVIDTFYRTVFDTTYITTYDTVTTMIYDTVTIYTYDTITRYINIAVEDTLNFSIYTDNCFNITHKLYPNPSSDMVYLFSNNADCLTGYRLEFIDALGRILETKPYATLVSFDVRSYATALYFVRLIGKDGDTLFSKKVVIR